MNLSHLETASAVRILPNLLSLDVCVKIIEEAEGSPTWSEADFYDHEAGRRIKKPNVRFSSHAFEDDAHTRFTDARAMLELKLSKFLAPDASPRFILTRLQLIRYYPGGQFAAHEDSHENIGRWRRFSLVIYLSDGFTGGGTSFENLGITKKPSLGGCVLFPSHYRHAGDIVESGVKYVLTSYLADPETTPPNS